MENMLTTLILVGNCSCSRYKMTKPYRKKKAGLELEKAKTETGELG